MKIVNFTDMSLEIKGYGYEYSMKQFIVHLLLSYGLLIVAGIFFQLHVICVLLLCVWAFLWLPIIVLAQFRYLANNHKFEIVVGYLEQMIFAFKKSPNILDCLKSVMEVVDQDMLKDIQKAISYIENDTVGTGYKLAFQCIEEKYRCTRIQSLHKFMLNVEENGGKYQYAIDILLEDIQTWVSRSYEYQKELKSIKGKITLSVILSIMIAGTMMAIIPKELIVFGNSIVYLVSTTILFSILIYLIAIVQTKLNGHWFVDDTVTMGDSRIKKAMKAVNGYDQKQGKKKSLISFMLMIPIFIVGLLVQNKVIAIVGILVAIGAYSSYKLRYKSARKLLQRALEKEFPIWLRDISMQLQTLVVPLAIRNSIIEAPLVLQSPLHTLIQSVEQYPTSIKPYTNFLKEYHLTDVSNAMKIMYTIQSLHIEDAHQQIDDLVKRNQKMLAKSERIRNEDMLMSIGLIVAAPMIISTLKLIIDLVLVLASFMSMSTEML